MEFEVEAAQKIGADASVCIEAVVAAAGPL